MIIGPFDCLFFRLVERKRGSKHTQTLQKGVETMNGYRLRKAKPIVVLSLFLIIISVFGGIRPASAATLAFKTENGEAIRDLCTGKDRDAYLLTSQRILRLSAGLTGGTLVEEISPNALDITAVCSTNDGLFGITASNEFYEYRDSVWSRIGALQAAYSTADDTAATVEFLRLAAIGSTVYACLYDDTTEQYQCLFIQRDEKTCSVIQDIQPRSLCVWDDSHILFDTLSQDDRCELVLYDTSSKTSAPLSIKDTPAICTAIAYDPANDMLYAAAPESIACSQAQGAFRKGIAIKYTDGLVPFAESSVLVWSGTSVYQSEAIDEPTTNALCVMGISTRFDNSFTADTGISVQACERAGMDRMESISFSMASRDSTVDIFGLLTRDGLERVKEKGMYVDMRQSGLLSAMIAELYPSLTDVLYDQERIAAWPIDVQPLCRKQDDALLLEYGITPPETLDELLDILPDVLDSQIVPDNHLRLFDTMTYTKKSFLNFLIRQYVFHQQKSQTAINFDTDLFRHLAQRIMNEVPLEDPFPAVTGDEMPLFMLSVISPVIQEGLLAPLALSSDVQPAIETWMKVAIINPYSKHIDNALRYLEYIAQHKDEYSYAYYSSMAEPYESPYALDEIARLTTSLAMEQELATHAEDEAKHLETMRQLEARIHLAQENRYLVTDAAIQQYHQLAQRFIVSADSLIQYDDSMETLIDQFIAGLYTLDGFIQACNQHVAMIYAENGVE